MSAASITCRRTLGMMRSLYSSSLAFGFFFAAAGALFAFALDAAEGSETPLAAVWASALAPVLPVLAAILAMDVWSDEKRTGRIESLLTAPVRERTLVIGKFLGVFSAMTAAVLVSLVATVFSVAAFSHGALSNQSAVSWIPGLLALLMQSALWSAVSLAASAMFRHSAAAAITSITLTVAIPRGLWHALMAYLPQERQTLGEMPLDEHVFDMANALVSTHVVLTYATLTVLALFFTSKIVAWTRFTGRGARSLRWSTAVTLLLAATLAAALSALYMRLGSVVELPLTAQRTRLFSARTRNILSEARGEITVSAFLSRKDSRFRSLAHFLRALSAEAAMLGGARVSVKYVDPNWDIALAERLVRSGAAEDSLVFERGRRRTVLSLRDGYDERAVASALLRVAMPPQRRSIYWTRGHGESAFDAYGSWGMSDIARDLAGDGYRNLPIDLASGQGVPEDCALIAIAGPRSDFSKSETAWLDAYLRKGGRLLVLAGTADSPSLAGLLAGWGIAAASTPITGARTMTGTDAIASDFADHPVSSPLAKSRLVLESPISFSASSAVEASLGADRIEYSPLAFAGEACVACVSERGAHAGDDLAIRPARVIAIGDATFAMNARLEARANSNRDFFMNSIAYLSGSGAITESGMETDRIVTGMDRRQRMHFAAFTIFVFPGIVFLLVAMCVASTRRQRT